MTLIRWEPMREVDNVRREMDRLFGELALMTNRDYLGRGSLIPAMELEETDADVIVRLEVPGMSSEDLDIQASADSISISGERRTERSETGEGFSRSEFHYGKFNRVVPLPTKVQNTQATADYANGILTLKLPKAESEKDKVVKISVDVAE